METVHKLPFVRGVGQFLIRKRPDFFKRELESLQRILIEYFETHQMFEALYRLLERTVHF